MSHRRERLKMKSTIRRRMIEAAKGSIDHRVFGYSIIVSDPVASPMMDERRKAAAQVDFTEEKILITFFDKDVTTLEKFSLGKCFSKEKLTRLMRLRWHPSLPIDEVLDGARALLSVLREDMDVDDE